MGTTIGRPSEFTEDIANQVCERLVEGLSIRKICAGDDMPAASTIFKWLSDYPSFSEQYAQARAAQMERWAEEIVEISDEEPIATIELQNGATKTCLDNAGVQRNRVRVDTRKWLMSKLAPKKYGDQLNVTGEVVFSVAEVLSTARQRLLAAKSTLPTLEGDSSDIAAVEDADSE